MKTVYVGTGAGGDFAAYIGRPPPTAGETPQAGGTSGGPAPTRWSLAGYLLFADTVTAAGVTALHAAGPAYTGAAHGSDAAGHVHGSPAVLTLAHAWRGGGDGLATLTSALTGGRRPAPVAGVGVKTLVGLPAASKVLLVLNASLATRAHSVAAATALGTGAGGGHSAAGWVRDGDAFLRDHRRDRGPDAPYDRPSSVHSVAAGGVVSAFLEGAVAVVRPHPLPALLPSLTPGGGVALALALLGAATDILSVNAALQLLADWSAGPAGYNSLREQRAHLVVAAHLRSLSGGESGKECGNASGRPRPPVVLDETTMQLCLCLCGLWDGAVVSPTSDDLAATGTPSHLVLWGHRSQSAAAAAIAASVPGYRPVYLRGNVGNPLGQTITDPPTLRHVLLHGHTWLRFTQAGQRLFLRALFNSVCGDGLPMPLLRHNRAVLRATHVFRYLLSTLLDARLTPARLDDVLLLLRYLLLDDVPYRPHISSLVAFLSSTLSFAGMSAVMRRLNGNTVQYPILATAQVSSPAYRDDPVELHPVEPDGDGGVSDAAAVGGAGGDADSDGGVKQSPVRVVLSTPVSDPAIAAISAAVATVSADGSRLGKRARSELLDEVTAAVVTTVRNHLLSMLPLLVRPLLARDTPLTFRYRFALGGAMHLRWLALFCEPSAVHPSTVAAALRLMCDLLPLYGPNLAGPAGQRSLSKVRPLAHRLTVFRYTAGDAPLVATVCEQWLLLLCVVAGARAPPPGTLTRSFLLTTEGISAALGPSPAFLFPDFYHVWMRLLIRTFSAPPDVALTSFTGGPLADVGKRLSGGGEGRGEGTSKRGGNGGAAAALAGGAGDSPSGASDYAATPSVTSDATTPCGTSALIAAIRFLTHYRTTCPAYGKYIERNRERVLAEYAALVFGAGVAATKEWRSQYFPGRRGPDPEGPPAPAPPAFFPFHHPACVAAMDCLAGLLADWVAGGVSKAAASVEFVLSLHPSVGEPPLLSADGAAVAADDVVYVSEYEALAVAFQTQVRQRGSQGERVCALVTTCGRAQILARVFRRVQKAVTSFEVCSPKVLVKLTQFMSARMFMWDSFAAKHADGKCGHPRARAPVCLPSRCLAVCGTVWWSRC